MKNLSRLSDDTYNSIAKDLQEKIIVEIQEKFPEISNFSVEVDKRLKITISGLREDQILQLDHIQESED